MPAVYFAPQMQSLLENARELRQDLTDAPAWRWIIPNRNAANALGVPEQALTPLGV